MQELIAAHAKLDVLVGSEELVVRELIQLEVQCDLGVEWLLEIVLSRFIVPHELLAGDRGGHNVRDLIVNVV